MDVIATLKALVGGAQNPRKGRTKKRRGIGIQLHNALTKFGKKRKKTPIAYLNLSGMAEALGKSAITKENLIDYLENYTDQVFWEGEFVPWWEVMEEVYIVDEYETLIGSKAVEQFVLVVDGNPDSKKDTFHPGDTIAFTPPYIDTKFSWA